MCNYCQTKKCYKSVTYVKKKTGRGNTVYKRDNNSKVWTYRKKVNGKTYYFNVGFDLKTAKKTADEIQAFLVFNKIEEAVARFNPNKINFGNVPTVDELIKVFEGNKDVLDKKPRTVRSYVNAIKRLVKTGTGKENPSCAINWNDCYVQYIRAMLDGIDEEEEILARKRTINSVLTNARALVSEDAMSIYSDLDMSWVPSIKALKKFKKVQVYYTLPSEKLILDTHNYLENLKCNVKFVMLALALHGGMRRSEIAHCRRSWFDLSGDEHNVIHIKPDKKFDPKGQSGRTVLKADWAQKIYARADGIDYLINANLDTFKTIDTIFEPLIADLRALGWDRNSPLHECRKLYGAFLATTDSLYKAQKCLRHSNPQTTSDSYSDLIMSDEIIQCWA